ncbi:hypothetical protein PR048_012647 [Dryococelus australis]|uniref:Uncharacterized protein n=1 Tax=Dryococelus australis TaxID=614101 RepID=A0ABQ9HQ40_9NEOP|nr:hypothetical protein PR048_012647 [Dryococelus australis]
MLLKSVMSLSTLSKKEVESRIDSSMKDGENKFLFTDFGGQPQCIMCAQVMSEALKSNLCIVTTEIEADIVALVNEHTAQRSH